MADCAIKDFQGSLDEFLQLLRSHSGLNVVEFSGTTCVPCKKIHGIMPEIAAKTPNAKFYCVYVDLNVEIGKYFDITTVPNVMLLKGEVNGRPKELSSIVGVKIPEMRAMITAYSKLK